MDYILYSKSKNNILIYELPYLIKKMLFIYNNNHNIIL